MNIYDFNDDKFKNTDLYKEYIIDNPVLGYLKIRASAASGAIPIKGLKVVVSKIVENNKIIFFEGYTNESGVIDKISLPAPTLDIDNLDVPRSTIYDIETTYIPNNINSLFKVRMYEGVYVVQNISIVPEMGIGGL